MAAHVLSRRISAAVAGSILAATAIAVPATALPSPGGDLSGDSRADVLVRVGSSDTIRSYFGNGSLSFSGSVSQSAQFSRADFAYPAPGFSGPRSADVIVRNHSDGALRLYRSSQGKLSGGYKIGHGWNVMDQLVFPGDFDGDGHPDVLARRIDDGSLMLYRGDGRGGWLGSRKIGHKWDVMDVLFSPGDFNGDGHPDVLARRSDDGALMMYRGNGAGGWRGAVKVGHAWQSMDSVFSVGDFDRDGAPDVIARRISDDALLLYRGNGRGGWRGSVKIGHNWGGLSLPGVWESTATQPLPDPGPLPKPTPTPTPPPQTRSQPFVYGTLRTGQRGYEMILRGKTTAEHKTTVASRDMYTKAGGAFPYSLPAAQSRAIVGQEMHIRSADYWSVLARLDRYENYDPSKPLTNQSYYRTTTTTARGTKVWIYDATPRMADYLRRYGVRIPSGDWLNRVIPRSAMGGTAKVADNSAVDFTVEDVSLSATCSNSFGDFTADNGNFVSLKLAIAFHGADGAEYLPVLAENLTVIDADGKHVDATSDAAVDCMAGSAIPDAFVDPGSHTSGTLVLDVDPQQLTGATLHYRPLPGIDLAVPIESPTDSTPAPTEGSTPEGEETDEG